MKNTLFCSPTHLRLVCGDANSKGIKIKIIAEIPLPEGGMSDGAIADKNIMIGFLTDIINKYELDHHETTFVIDNDYIRVKRIDVPSLKHTEVMDIITKDFSEHDGHPSGNILDYAITDKKRGENGFAVLAAAIGKSLIETYLDVILGAGLNLKNIAVGPSLRFMAEDIDIENDIHFVGDTLNSTGAGEIDLSSYMLNIAALLVTKSKRKDINMLLAFEELQGKRRKHPKLTLRTISISAAALIVISFGAFYMIQTAGLQDDKTAAIAYLNDAKVKANYEETLAAARQIEHAEKTSAALVQATENLSGYPELTSDQLRQISKIASTRKTSIKSIDFNRNTGLINMSCVSESATHVPIFISNLRSCGLFESVTYDGYTSIMVISENESIVKYEFTVKATVNAPDAEASAQGENKNV